MTEQEKLRKFVEDYRDKEGNNPVAAAISLFTIMKMIPIHLFTVGVMAVLVYLGTIGLGWLLGLGWPMMLVIIFGGLSSGCFIFITGMIRSFSITVIDAIKDLLVGLIAPIDDMYDLYTDINDDDMGRLHFAKRVLAEIVMPRVSKVTAFIPMKNWQRRGLNIFSGLLSADAKKQITQDDLAIYEAGKESFIKRMVARINGIAKTSNWVAGRPLFIALFIHSFVFVILCLWHFLPMVLG